MDGNKLIKSPLNYTGGKYKLLPQLLPIILLPPPHKNEINTFVDLFTGGGNVVANVNAKKRIANDINGSVIDIFKTFQTRVLDDILKEIYSKIEEYNLTIDNQESYNVFRNMYNKSTEKDPIDLFVLICYSFNHQIRFNSKGEYNMPFGKNRSQFNKTIEQNLINFHKTIKDVIFTNKSFTELKIDKLSKDDYVYCDPPYLITCASYNEQDGWNETQERQLYELLDNLNEREIRFGLSNVFENKGNKNEMLIEWSKKYNVHHFNHSYGNCSYHAKNKSKSTDEVFITNY